MKLKNLVDISKASGLILLAFSLYTTGYGQQVKPLGVLNSPYDEQHPVFSPTGEIFYSIGFHPQNSGGPTDFGDIWMSKKNDKQEWSSPVRVADLSTSGNDVVVGFSDALTILVYHEGNGKKQGIHQYSRFGNSWNYLRPLEMGNFKNNAKHFSGRLNSEGTVMILSMTSYGSFGNEDLYVSFKLSEGKWSSPQNLGREVNTLSQELTPYLSDDLKTLYYSSNASNAAGNNRGRDIYYTHRLDDSWEKWTVPQPIKHANSVGSELSYIPMDTDEALAIFTSTQNSEGFGDLMVIGFENFEVPEEEILISEDRTQKKLESIQEPDSLVNHSQPQSKVDTVSQMEIEERIAEEESNPAKEKPAAVETGVEEEIQNPASFSIISVQDYNTKEELDYTISLRSVRGLKKTVNNQEELLKLLEEPGWTNILVNSKGYLPQDLELQDWKNLTENDEPLLMKPARAGTSIVLDNIQFNRGTSDFADAKSIQILDNLAEFLKDNPEVRIRLEGHTDNAGDPILNKELSLNRASKIRGYLTLNGVDFERVRISGWGGTRPVAGNDTEDGRNQNRRVEMLIEQ